MRERVRCPAKDSPVMSAPSSTSPIASESWKLSSWYRVFPVLVSLRYRKIAPLHHNSDILTSFQH